jgi:hypothetical protein
MASTDLTYLRQLARDGDDSAIGAWGDALEEAGDAEGALALHRLPALQREMEKWLASRRGMEKWLASIPRSRWRLDVQLFRGGWRGSLLSVKANRVGSGDHPSPRIILERWNDLCEAMEWLARRLELLGVVVSVYNSSREERFLLDQQNLHPFPGVKLDRVRLYHR